MDAVEVPLVNVKVPRDNLEVVSSTAENV